MASESVTTDIMAKAPRAFRLDAMNIEPLRRNLINAIQAQTELERVTQAIKDAAKAGWPASYLTSEALAPRTVEMDIYEVADLVQLLDVLDEA